MERKHDAEGKLKKPGLLHEQSFPLSETKSQSKKWQQAQLDSELL